MKFIKISIILVIMFSLIGCTHNLEIKNLDQYQNLEYIQLKEKPTIGIIPDVEDINHRKIIKGVAEKLAQLNTVSILPYCESSIFPVDYIVKISMSSEYKGSWVNYFIDFPGFLIWTPVWNGYVYKNYHDIKITLIDGKTKQEISQYNVPLKLDIRQADIRRTWTECGYVSWVIPLIGGFFHIQYDDDVTKMVTNEIYYPIGQYIAEEITNYINSYK